MNDSEMLLEQDENNFYMRTDHTANRRIRYYNMLLEFYSKYCRFNIFVIVLLLLIIIFLVEEQAGFTCTITATQNYLM